MIPHEIGGVQNDALRFGLHGVKSDIVGAHPLETSYHSVSIFASLSFPFQCLQLSSCSAEQNSAKRIN